MYGRDCERSLCRLFSNGRMDWLGDIPAMAMCHSLAEASMSATVEIVVDWQAMLNELRHMGIRTGQISMRVGLSSGNIREYRLGIKSPMHCNGERIIEYWMRLTAKTRDQLPMIERVG